MQRRGLIPATRLSYRVGELAQLTGLSRRLVYALVESGQVRAVKVHNAWIVPAAEVARLLAGDIKAPADRLRQLAELRRIRRGA